MFLSALFVPLALVCQQGDPDIIRVNPFDYKQCGIGSFYLACRVQNINLDYQSLVSAMGDPAADGTHSFADMLNAANLLGVAALPIYVLPSDLRSLPTPAILQVHKGLDADRPPHFVTAVGFDEDGIVILDPPMPAQSLPIDQFSKRWTGNALIIRSTDM